jgi:K+-sensing histidine kinase KdpD
VSTLVLTAAMLPLRDHLSIATTALVLVVPVVVGVASGGFAAGVVSVIGGFLVYDYFFIPPYWTRQVGATENWTALAVYAIILVPIARVVANMIIARGQAQARGLQLRRLFEVSGLLIEDRSLDELLSTIVTTLRDVFDARQVALLLPHEDQLEIVASAGEPLTADDRARIRPSSGRLSSLDTEMADIDQPFGLALVAAGGPVGLLTISGSTITAQQREPLRLFANQAAFAVERAQLREQVLRTELTDEVARLARTLVAAVSHDLRSPLASIKAASSILADPQLAAQLDHDTRGDLTALIDEQTDRLGGLVTNLLDMGRVQAGVLQPKTARTTVGDIIHSALDSLPAPPRTPAPDLEVSDSLPAVEADLVLTARVLANLLDNAHRHAPKNTPVVIAAELTRNDTVTVSVTDEGPGVSPDRRGEIFGFYARRSHDSGTGLGLAIAKTFVEAHHQRIWVETAPGGGARFCFTLAVATPPPEGTSHGRDPHRR